MYENMSEEMKKNKKDSFKIVLFSIVGMFALLIIGYFAGKFDRKEDIRLNIDNVQKLNRDYETIVDSIFYTAKNGQEYIVYIYERKVEE